MIHPISNSHILVEIPKLRRLKPVADNLLPSNLCSIGNISTVTVVASIIISSYPHGTSMVGN